MSARIITQITYDAYCPDCGWVIEGFDDDEEAQLSVDVHNKENHR